MMGLRLGLVSWAIVPLVALTSPVAMVSQASAQSDCTCLISETSPGSALGSISKANGDVFKTGSLGLVSAPAGTEVNAGDVITTGASSSANISLGNDCVLALGASAEVTITPVDGNICVRLVQEPAGGNGVGLGLAAAGGLGAGALLFVGLGQDNPASQ